jgi:hypothetical protein
MKILSLVEAVSRTSLLLALGCLAAASAAAAEWSDPEGDVASSRADIVAGSATGFNGMADLRLRFAGPPFEANVGWVFDTDRNPATSSFPTNIGADAALSIDGRFDALATCNFVMSVSHGLAVNTFEIDHYSAFWYDPETYTVRVLVPLSLITDDPSFNYAVTASFSGSGGGNESAPDAPDFSVPGGFFTSEEGPLPDFGGSLWCTRETVPIDIQPDNPRNVINLQRHGQISVAVLTTGTFDATTLFWFTALFGPTGTEAEPLSSAYEDADHDGDLDLVLTYDLAETGLRCGDKTATLKAYGEARHGVQGTGPILTVGCH